jgi:hypothetical protein
MSGLLEIEISGDSPGNGTVGYDQIQIVGPAAKAVSLDGDLSLAWSGTGWSSASDRLWIIRNDTDGTLTGAFYGYANGAVVGDYDGQSWRIWYGLDADAPAGSLVAGNDVLLAPATAIPESGSLGLAISGLLVLLWAGRWRLAQLRGRQTPRF